MAEQRIKGQEVSIIVTRDGNVETTLVDIVNFNAIAKFEIIEKGYLGEKNNRHDYIFHGIKFDFELNIHTQDWFTYFQAQLDKAKRNTPDVTFNITAVLSFPNGDTPSVLLADVAWGELPMNVTSRQEYVKLKLDGACDDIEVTTS